MSAGRLIAVDGACHGAVAAAARRALAAAPRSTRGGISWWDASGVFHELAVGSSKEAGTASARTLLLLYAADLAFRLRWEIRPMLEAGRTVVAAPYVETAVAFGRAAGIPAGWMRDLFLFAPKADAAIHAAAAPARRRGRGFVEFGCEHLAKGGQPRHAARVLERTTMSLGRRDGRRVNAGAEPRTPPGA